jgi:predicted nucleic acid-binding protein
VYLIDTNIVSLTAPARGRATALVQWLENKTSLLFVSVITVAEIESGVAKLRREGAQAKAENLARWLETLLHLYSERVLALDIPTARTLGALADLARASGRPTSFADIAIAATARQRGLIILTRNLKHFVPLGVPAHDPLASLPG